jgi:hypothetical protein
MPSPPKDRETANLALRICRELYRFDAGRPLRWHEAWAIEQKLGIDEEAAQEALRFAVAKRWVATVGDPVFSIELLEDGRRLVAEESSPPAEKPKPRAVKDVRRKRGPI